MTNATKLDLIKSVDVIGPRRECGGSGVKTVRGRATGTTSADVRFLTRAASAECVFPTIVPPP